MAIRLELEDLPPRYREQAQRQIAQRQERQKKEQNKTPGGLPDGAPKSERDYYLRVIVPPYSAGRSCGCCRENGFCYCQRVNTAG